MKGRKEREGREKGEKRERKGTKRGQKGTEKSNLLSESSKKLLLKSVATSQQYVPNSFTTSIFHFQSKLPGYPTVNWNCHSINNRCKEA